MGFPWFELPVTVQVKTQKEREALYLFYGECLGMYQAAHYAWQEVRRHILEHRSMDDLERRLQTYWTQCSDGCMGIPDKIT